MRSNQRGTSHKPYDNMKDKNVRKTRTHGFSVVISVTGFADPGVEYRIEKDGNRIILTKVGV